MSVIGSVTSKHSGGRFNFISDNCDGIPTFGHAGSLREYCQLYFSNNVPGKKGKKKQAEINKIIGRNAGRSKGKDKQK
jgi:hypothetical protein